jgi:hypothetical protein
MPTYVIQAPAPQSQTSQNPSQSFDNPTTPDSLLVLFIEWANTSGSVISVQDSLGNDWEEFDFYQPAGSSRTSYCFAAQNSDDGGNCTVTINTDASRTYSFRLFEVSGGVAILDGTPVHATANNAAPTTGTLVTSYAGSIVFADVKSGAINTSPIAPWVSDGTNNAGTAYRQNANPGSFNTAWTTAAGNWVTTILAFQGSGGGPPPPLGPYPIISDLLSAGLLATPSIVESPVVGAISFRTTWKVVQASKPSTITSDPNDPSFNWSFLDSAVAQAMQYGKLISFHIAVQGFGQPTWVENNAQQFTAVTGNQIAVYWDTYYQSALAAFIQAVGQRYGSNINLYKTVWTIPSEGSSWSVPHKSADITNWINPPYNYTTAQLVSAAETILNVAAQAFPNSFIQLQVGTSGRLDVYPGGPIYQYNAATQIAQYAYANLPRFAMDRDGFNPQNPTPSQALAQQDSSGWYLLAQTLAGSSNTSGTTGSIPQGGSVFGQADWPATDPSGAYTPDSTNNYLANGGVPYTDPIPVVLGTITSARYYNVRFLELYEQDLYVIIPPAPPPAAPWGLRLLGKYGIITPNSPF